MPKSKKRVGAKYSGNRVLITSKEMKECRAGMAVLHSQLLHLTQLLGAVRAHFHDRLVKLEPASPAEDTGLLSPSGDAPPPPDPSSPVDNDPPSTEDAS